MRPPDALPVSKLEPTTSAEVKATHYEGSAYLAWGGDEPHWVWYDGEYATCDCADFIWRSRVCKHIRAVCLSDDTPPDSEDES